MLSNKIILKGVLGFAPLHIPFSIYEPLSNVKQTTPSTQPLSKNHEILEQQLNMTRGLVL